MVRQIGGGIAAAVISTAAIVVFGEIIPQAVSVRYYLSILLLHATNSHPRIIDMVYQLALVVPLLS